jgi:hypothetical protein
VNRLDRKRRQEVLMLTKGDDYPLHQTAEPIAYAGTDRNFYDRYFFSGYAPTGDRLFALAFGVYPHLNIADASFCVVRDGVETALHASRWLGMERMDLHVGPIRIEVVEPLQKLKIVVDAPDQRLRAEIVFEARHFPEEEPRFTRRIGPRTFMDYTRLTQNGRYDGWIELDGAREAVSGFVGTRDRSWGIRPVGARDSQDTVPPALPQFFWLWTPCNFEDGSLFFHTNDDAAGEPWNRRAVWAPDGAGEAGQHHFAKSNCEIEWVSGTRNARSGLLRLWDDSGETQVSFTPLYNFRMLGLGYGHPKWGHGVAHGELAVEREDIVLADVDPKLPQHLHVQALSEVTMRSPDGRERTGRGLLEQLALGPHGPSGFKSILDMAE